MGIKFRKKRQERIDAKLEKNWEKFKKLDDEISEPYSETPFPDLDDKTKRKLARLKKKKQRVIKKGGKLYDKSHKLWYKRREKGDKPSP